MSKSSFRDRPTRILVTASKICRALSPSKFGLLFVIYRNKIQHQRDISDAIGRTQSTVSTYLQELGTLTPPLAGEHGGYYTVTRSGEKIISLVDNMARRCGPNLESIDWTDKTDRNAVGSILTPLHDSRGLRPFFILDSLYERSGITGPTGVPDSVRFDDIVRDVETRQDDIGESTTTKQVRRTVKLRFDDTDVVHFEAGQVTLKEKGHLQAWVLNELIQFLKEQEEWDSSEATDATIPDTENTAEDDADIGHTELNDSPHSSNNLSGILQQFRLESLRGSSQSSNESPAVIPVYSLHLAEVDRKRDALPVLPLTAETTIKELNIFTDQLANEYDEDTKLVLEWMVQTESGLYPLSVMDSHTSDIDLEMQNG